jgi:DNA segregation ATPase FtsK/SpoIIIE-like protein
VRRDAGDRLPWVIKKQILIAHEAPHDATNSVKYLEMQVPLAVKSRQGGDEFHRAFPDASLHDEDECIEARRNLLKEDGGIAPGGKLGDTGELQDGRDFQQHDDGIFDDENFSLDCGDEDCFQGGSCDRAAKPVALRRNRITDILDEAGDVSGAADAALDDAEPVEKVEGCSQWVDRKDVENLARPEVMVFSRIPLNQKYIIPTDFLNTSTPIDSESWLNEVKKNSALLVNTLADFGIESRVVNVNRGPVITLFELQIAPGIKVNRIVGLADDIAMALAAYRVRIVAPIPGKSAIGVEIPNRQREEVTLGDIIHSEQYTRKEGVLKVALGKDILGKPLTLDLKKLPHLLIAGATGSGKSVCVNTIITSLVYRYDPNYVRFILVDPKMVELQLYNGLPHLLTPVITEPFVAPTVLKWAVYEMERRYRLLSSMNTRDIERYNEKIRGTGNRNEHLPYIVIIIDELADLMMVASKEIEGFITRIAQKARAVGIHLVLATQRPSVDIITGILKAHFPARIAFQVAQKTDSRTIIDQNGAEKLLGRGDMLFLSPNGSYPVRIQGAYISEDEIMTVVDHLGSLGEPEYIDIEESLFNADSAIEGDDQSDELFVEALKIVEETRKASASYLQRRLSIGYNRAARIIEMMEERGYIGPQQGSKPREILI